MSELSPWGGFSRDPRGPETGGLRASDADRDHAAELLSDAYAEGRLPPEEYEKRLDVAMQAAYLKDFSPLIRDIVLPELPAPPPTPAPRPWYRTPMFAAVSASAGVLIAIAVLILVFGGTGAWWWMVWPFMFFVLPQVIGLLKEGITRSYGHGGTNQLPNPNTDYPREDDDDDDRRFDHRRGHWRRVDHDD